MDKLSEEMKTLKTGDPLDEEVTFGPMIDLDNAERIESWTQQAVAGGGKILVGGNVPCAKHPCRVLNAPSRSVGRRRNSK